jgi:fructose-specific phosphotransferase system IIC component
MSKETSRPNPSTTTRRSLTLTVIGWILAVPFGAAVINAIYAFGAAYLTDMNQETTSWMRVGAVVLLVLATPFAVGGWALIRRGRRVSKQAQTTPQPIV